MTATVAHTAEEFLCLGHRKYVGLRLSNVAREYLARMDAEPSLRPVRVSVTSALRLTPGNILGAARDIIRRLGDRVVMPRAYRDVSPVGREHLYVLALVRPDVEDDDIVDAVLDVVPGAGRSGQLVDTLDGWANASKYHLCRSVERVLRYARHSFSSLRNVITGPRWSKRDTVTANDVDERICAECGASLEGRRAHAKVCSKRCRWRAWDRRRKRLSEVESEPPCTPSRVRARLDAMSPTPTLIVEDTSRDRVHPPLDVSRLPSPLLASEEDRASPLGEPSPARATTDHDRLRHTALPAHPGQRPSLAGHRGRSSVILASVVDGEHRGLADRHRALTGRPPPSRSGGGPHDDHEHPHPCGSEPPRVRGRSLGHRDARRMPDPGPRTPPGVVDEHRSTPRSSTSTEALGGESRRTGKPEFTPPRPREDERGTS